MFILFGTRGLKHTIKESPVLPHSCPNCNKGNLVHTYSRRWFTVFFVPVIPLNVTDRFYECDRCKSAYNENIKTVLKQSQQRIVEHQKQARLAYAQALIATMTHMAIIDGDFDIEEEREIMGAFNEFSEIRDHLMIIHYLVKEEGNTNNLVFSYLNEARNLLSPESLVDILAQVTAVLLADGTIESGEEKLMKEYLIACGQPKEMYHTLIDKLKKKDILTIKKEQLN